MPKFTVYITESVDYSVRVEAATEDEAVTLAEQAHINGDSDFVGISTRDFDAHEDNTQQT